MTSIKQNIAEVINQITLATEKCGRAADSVQLLAVSKTKPVEAIEEAITAGQYAFGENYVQEGVDKVNHFASHPEKNLLVWHFIGPIQSNKTRLVAEHFDWVHSIDRIKTAKRLSDQRPTSMAPLQVLLQVNSSAEATKSGITLAEVPALAAEIAAMPNIELRGLMSIPQPATDYDSQFATFKALADTLEQLKLTYPNVDTLSMGMSGDMEAAIAAGSTIVRIGTAIFGARDYGNKE
ncbi:MULTISPECIES: YggS family pyridoxal phosphate-dependent enzyme [unclassified Photobacterium]|uniref:YggS family pyridoxal phosphate-dependent enzyme n=1 Tax=unclassified Photobacterium TaxID=2628852 RepID=UPI000D16BD4F|nr:MULTISPECIES: YggS family pyridoxal phosphate-dependent enzyme [unclassified Photobacterium]PSV26573.1 YggS family pyridoxal phosphate-dependent enzyme [Photobacterium sp. GB-56]PSV31766.1 YggS family pyridoxal phosphate-dependent enzyme [Photobacterium sp. GB-72]PSV37471.1 YggS family pyridoxal phosphate-dependent enzyme [Photobacterium sp. GB-27]PSV39119.1 YggS family pyridoxal phosphate-dependent enzyme [Photobacterium sp. GB-210]PSV45410.1 YggS family pyridoxal phosphate-dependent enzym